MIVIDESLIGLFLFFDLSEHRLLVEVYLQNLLDKLLFTLLAGQFGLHLPLPIAAWRLVDSQMSTHHHQIIYQMMTSPKGRAWLCNVDLIEPHLCQRFSSSSPSWLKRW